MMKPVDRRRIPSTGGNMRSINRHRRLPAMAMFTALATAAPVAFSQSPAPPPTAPLQHPPAQPQPPPTPEELGDSLFAHQRYQAAIETYKKAPRDSASVWNKMGIAYQMMYNMQDATRCYQVSLKLNPGNANVVNNLGTVYDSLKQYGAAERMYRRALKLDPKSAVILKNLGTNLLSQHQYKKGWEAYQAALAIDPHIFENNTSPMVENPTSHQDRGAMNFYMAKGCVRAGMNDRAIEYLRMALNEGFTTPRKIAADSEFNRLRGIPAFEQLLAAQGTP
jgi:tetratricopeptide (TPR) repeat protein